MSSSSGGSSSSSAAAPVHNARQPLSNGVSSPSSPGCLRDLASAVHRSSMHGDWAIRRAAVASLESMASAAPLAVVQTWLDQFARVNGGGAPAEYAAAERVHLLRSLEKIVGVVVRETSMPDEGAAGKACTGRLIAMATEEMTKQADVIPDVQKPCSNILVSLGERCFDRVMDALLLKMKPNQQQPPHFFVVTTVSGLTRAYGPDSVPYLKQVMASLAASMRSVKKENLKYAYATAFAAFAEAILEHMSNNSEGGISAGLAVDRSTFCPEVDQAHDVLFSSWISSRDFKVRHSTLEALGKLSRLVSPERLLKNACPIITVLINSFKRTGDPYYSTSCVFQTIEAISEENPEAIESVVESLLTALFSQVCAHMTASPDYSKPNALRNHHEVFRCYDILVRHHEEKLVKGLVVRMGSVDESIRLAALAILKHLLTTSFDRLEGRMPEVFSAVHAKLGEGSPKVQGMLAQVAALFGRKGYLQGKEGKDFVEFIVALCSSTAALRDADKEQQQQAQQHERLGETCGSILQLLARSVPSVEAILWPHLLDSLMQPNHRAATAPIVKSLNEIVLKRVEREGSPEAAKVEFSLLELATSPQAVLARLLTLAAVPHSAGSLGGCRGWHILAFLVNFAPNVSRHLSALWSQRIPLLQHYLDTHMSTAGASGGPASSAPAVLVASPWDQDQWEKWLLELLGDTLKEVGVDEWGSALAEAFKEQMALYSDEGESQEKGFLIRCVGVIMRVASSRNLVLAHLSLLEQVASSPAMVKRPAYSRACAEAFGLAAASHLDLVLGKLESLLRERFSKRGGSFFGLLRDSKAEEDQAQAQRFVLSCVGRAASLAPRATVAASADRFTLKFITPALKSANKGVKVSALEALASLASSLKFVGEEGPRTELAQHGDLVRESISCLKQVSWSLEEKRIVLSALLELVRCRPLLGQMDRCSLLRACFSAAFPAVAAENYTKEECYSVLAQRNGALRETVEKLQELVEELLRQDLQQSTLDEIFTLLEPWIKREQSFSREMAVSVLQGCLRSFVKGMSLGVGEPSDFSPGPYFIGGVVPCCFDETRQVQGRALDCLHTILRILAVYEGLGDGGQGEEECKRLAQLSVACLQQDSDASALSAPTVSSVVSTLLSKRVQTRHLLALLDALMESLTDLVTPSARGSSTVLSSIFQTRGRELAGNAVELAEKLLRKLMVLEGCDETRVRALSSMRHLADLSHRDVCRRLLSLPICSPLPGQEEALSSIWRVMAQERGLAARVLEHLVDTIEQSDLYAEDSVHFEASASTTLVVRVARHGPVAASVAAEAMMRMREMEPVCEEVEFAYVFAPLMSAACCFAAGVQSSEAVEATEWEKRVRGEGDLVVDLDESLMAHEGSPALMGPLGAARAALSAYLECKGCPSVARAADAAFALDLNGSWDVSKLEYRLNELCRAACRVYEGVIQDAPQFLTRLASQLEPLLGHRLMGRRLAAAAFFAQVLSCEVAGGVEPSLKRSSLSCLLSLLRRERGVYDYSQTGRSDEEEEEGGQSKAGGGYMSEETKEQTMKARAEVRRQESIALRILCLQGISAVRLGLQEELGGGTENNAASVLSAFLSEIGEDFRSGLNLSALGGLKRLLSCEDLDAGDVRPVFSEIAGKVRPFFDSGGGAAECAAAIQCFSLLPQFAAGSSSSSYAFSEHAHGAMVSLLVHCSDEETPVRRASREGMARILGHMLLSQPAVAEAVRCQCHAEDQQTTNFDYESFFREVSSCREVSQLFPTYASSALGYFKSPDPRLRASAVHLLSGLLCHMDEQVLARELELEKICASLAALLSSDKSMPVQEAANKSMGKIFVQLNKGLVKQ